MSLPLGQWWARWRTTSRPWSRADDPDIEWGARIPQPRDVGRASEKGEG